MLRNFIEVDLESFVVDTALGLDVYIHRDSDFVLFRAGDLPFTQDHLQHLRESGHERVFIAAGDERQFRDYVEANIGRIVADPHIPTDKKSRIVYRTSTSLMKDLFNDPRSSDRIKRSKKLISHTVDLILSGEEATRQLIAITAHDYYTYSHSVNVTIFALALCERLFGRNGAHDFHKLGYGFLLHDLGKSLIDPDIINKPGTLSSKEWKIMKQHPQFGRDLLGASNESSEEIKTIVLEHHERYEGGGYPTSKGHEEIHAFGRICCVADVFDALTTRRTYRRALPTFEALTVMRDYMKGHFDPEFLREFILLLRE